MAAPAEQGPGRRSWRRTLARLRPRARVVACGQLLALALCLACATIEAPPGGPVDVTPPRLAAAWPESGRTGLRGVRELALEFSEKVETRDGARLVSLYPPLPIAATHWDGRRRVRLVLADSLPADTVVVVELPARLADAHGVVSTQPRAWPLATADSLPAGEIFGAARLGELPLIGGLVELHAVPPETVRWFQQAPLRRASTDSLGGFRLPWLPVPGGPWLLHVFADGDGDRRRSEDEPSRLVADTLRLAADAPRRELPRVQLYSLRTPGRLLVALPESSRWDGPVLGWAETIAEGDTGWSPAPRRARPAWQAAARGQHLSLPAGPGLARAILFCDLTGDSLFSRAAAAAGESLHARLEPWALLDSLTLAPGDTLRADAPAFPDTLTPWLAPPDSAGAPGVPGAETPPRPKEGP